MDLGALVTTFALVIPVELPDKTFVATLLLATRFRPWAVWLGVTAAFVVQSLVAVVAGRLLGLLPGPWVHGAAAVLFGAGAVILLRGARRSPDQDAYRERPGAGVQPVGGVRAALSCFLVLGAAEWGDLSQLLTAGLAARFGAPVEVFVGAVAALALVSGLAVLAGQQLLKRIRLSRVQMAGGMVCAGLAALTAVQALSG